MLPEGLVCHTEHGPEAFQGEGLYIQGDQKKTFVLYYSRIITLLGEENDRD